MNNQVHPVSFSPQALDEIRKIMQTKGIPPDYHLRVGVRGGGCGVTHIIGFDRQQEHDARYETNGVSVIYDRRQMMYLIGKQVEFFEGDDRRGFHFTDTPVSAT
ncbi:MAG: iron-sulfur cluster biosynthesis family protein [Bacteroidota bacterium]